MNIENAVEVRNMSKTFRIQTDRANSLKSFFLNKRKNVIQYNEVLKNININIKKGETVALIGTNGSGKSTLLKLMTKIIYPTKGTIKTQGKLTSLLELGAGFHPDFTGRENIYFNAAVFGLNQKEIEERMDDIISFSELGKFIDEPIRTYSSGMYMRLAFSIAINVDADILLIDEILAVGDQHFQDKCFAKLRELKESKRTIVIVSHSLDVIKELCTRVIWIYKGTFRLDGDPHYVIDEYLKQVSLDNRLEKKMKVQAGEEKYKGIIFFDAPKPFVNIASQINDLSIQGWAISDCEEAKLELFVAGKKVDLKRYPRPDVEMIYNEQFGGFMDVDKIGWSAHIEVESFKPLLSDNKELVIQAQLCDEKENIIQKERMIIYVGKDKQ
jgi:hypothetical protein